MVSVFRGAGIMLTFCTLQADDFTGVIVAGMAANPNSKPNPIPDPKYRCLVLTVVRLESRLQNVNIAQLVTKTLDSSLPKIVNIRVFVFKPEQKN